jgi:hypothetical protein
VQSEDPLVAVNPVELKTLDAPTGANLTASAQVE